MVINTSEQGAILYEERIVAFLDILGFKALVDSSSRSPSAEEEYVNLIRDALEWANDELHEDGRDAQFTHFSDSFVISHYADTHHELHHFLYLVRSVIETMLYSGLLVRGGITVGKLFHKDGLLFGPAMNRAYYLESEVASYPRVVLDGGIDGLAARLTKQSHRNHKDGVHYLCLDVEETDDDGVRYIEYITKTRKVYFLVPSYLCCVREVIKRIPETSQSLMAKKNWLIRRFNEALKRSLPVEELECKMTDKIEWGGGYASVLEEDFERIMRDAKSLSALPLC